MSNCFGLKLLYSYLNKPFLALKKANLLQALNMIEGEAAAADKDMLGLIHGSPYDGYVEHLSRTKGVRARPPRVNRLADGDAKPTAKTKVAAVRLLEQKSAEANRGAAASAEGAPGEAEGAQDQKGELTVTYRDARRASGHKSTPSSCAAPCPWAAGDN